MKLLIPLLLCTPFLLHAQAEPAPAPVTLTNEQMANIMQQLEQIETEINKNRTDTLSTAINQLKAASASEKAAIDLYLTCQKIVEFDRKNRKTSEFQTWRDGREELFKHADFGTAIRLQIEYLLLTIQAHQAEDLAPVISPLQAYVGRATAAVQASTKHTASGVVESTEKASPQKRVNRQLIPQNPAGVILNVLKNATRDINPDVRASVFSKAFYLEDHLTRKDWEYVPLNIAGIYGLTILPYYIQEKPAELAAQWDQRINTELALQKAQQSETEFQIFYALNYPEYQWAKAQSLFSNNINTMQALADMLKVVRENRRHAKAVEWLKQLREAITKVQPADPSPGLTELPEAVPATTSN